MVAVNPYLESKLAQYGEISISQWLCTRLDRTNLQAGRLVEVPTTCWRKDYDRFAEDLPSAYGQRFSVENWVTVCIEGIGGAIVAFDSPDFDMLEGRRDLAVIVDFRVRPCSRGEGVGRAIFSEIRRWALERGCSELRVETQDTNPSACQFYRAMGFRLFLIEEGAYGAEIDELKLIWSLSLGERRHEPVAP